LTGDMSEQAFKVAVMSGQHCAAASSPFAIAAG
jgi:hypothetical protein